MRSIRRAGELVGKRNLTVIKVSKPKQDMRFDVPVVGTPTIENMVASGATALIIDAHRTLLLGETRFTALADQNDIAIVVSRACGVRVWRIRLGDGQQAAASS